MASEVRVGAAIHKQKVNRMKTRKTSERARGGEKKSVLLILLILLLAAVGSLFSPSGHHFKGEKIEDKIAVEGKLSLPDLTGACQLTLDDGRQFIGQLEGGRPAGPGEVHYPDGSQVKGHFDENGIRSPQLTFPNGESWVREEGLGWKRVTEGAAHEEKN